MNVLELFSGIGGMHFALKESKIPAEVVEALDINTIANNVYTHNFVSTKVCQNNLQAITADYINKREIDVVLMSPPCQPFTRQGKKLDVDDTRCAPLLHFISLIPKLNSKLKYVLLENVEGFQHSNACHLFINTLKDCDFHYTEFILSPHDFGFPNSRRRYYLLAKKQPLQFSKELWDIKVWDKDKNTNPVSVGDILEISDSSEDYNSYLLSDEVLLRRAWLLDIVTKKSNNSCCFTRGYTHYIEGTGSVYCPFEDSFIKETFEKEKNLSSDYCEEKLKLLKALRLRFFTPKEVANLLCFPNSFSFPNDTSMKQKYRLLGNSINVKVVSKLIQLLFSDNFNFDR